MKQVNCVICNSPIKGERERKWAVDDGNHPGVLGPCHKKCYDNAVVNDPELPWTDPISGEVDYEQMAQDLGVDIGEEEGDEEDYF